MRIKTVCQLIIASLLFLSLFSVFALLIPQVLFGIYRFYIEKFSEYLSLALATLSGRAVRHFMYICALHFELAGDAVELSVAKLTILIN